MITNMKILVCLISILLVETRRASIPKLKFDCSRMPTVCGHMVSAIDRGQPSVLRYEQDSSRAAANRKSAYGGYRAGSGRSMDEYPFASTAEGGYGADVRAVPRRENSIQGAQLSNFYRKNGMQQGDKYRVDVEHIRKQVGGK